MPLKSETHRISIDHWDQAPTVALTEHLARGHRDWLETDIPALELLLDRASGGESGQVLRRNFRRWSGDLEAHVRAEEMVLFPAILESERRAAAGPPVRAAFGSMRHPVTMLKRDHQDSEQEGLALLALITELGEPELEPFRACLAGLLAKIAVHTELEDQVLFTRALRLDAKKQP